MNQMISLNGAWDFVADLDPKYHGDTRIYPAPAYAHPDANRRHWLSVPVPGAWQKYAERYDIFEGVCWFAREFTVTGRPSGSVCRLHFGAVNYLCDVYVNGEKIGGHETGYTEFALDATGRVHEGVNHVAVMVDNRASTIKWPPCLGYFNYGGIHREVALEVIDTACMSDITVDTGYRDGSGWLSIQGAVTRAHGFVTPDDRLRVEVVTPGRTVTATVEGGRFAVRLSHDHIQPWAPEAPQLYPLAVRLVASGSELDFYETDIGYRTIEVSDGRISLNGTSLQLKGVCYVYESPREGIVMTQEQIQTDIGLLKDMGCNAVRCHYPMSREFYQGCDRAGLIVWIEPTVYCLHPLDDDTNTPFSDSAWIELAQTMITEMVDTAHNHPSVLIYGIGNECNANNTEAEGFFRSLAQTLRSADPTRLVSYAALYGVVGNLADIVDVLGINSYWGWYDKIFGGKGLEPDGDGDQVPIAGKVETIDLSEMRQMLDKVLHDADHELVLLLTEFGADSVPGYLASSRDLWSENYHADLLRDIVRMASTYPQIAGTFPFCFSDYRDPSKVQNGYWNEINLKGVVTLERKKKLAFEALRECYR